MEKYKELNATEAAKAYDLLLEILAGPEWKYVPSFTRQVCTNTLKTEAPRGDSQQVEVSK